MKEINPNFFYAIDVDDANKFKSALWVDARCRDSYEYYGDVVSFDTTYKRNRHGLPFASFVGVNHHRKSTLLGCALLGSEETPSFEWVFITDQFKAMAGAIRKVLPDTVHQWCIWHIMKKSQFKVGGSISRFRDLSKPFEEHFAGSAIYLHDSDYLNTIKQGQQESLRDYITRFTKIAMSIPDLHPEVELHAIKSGLRPGKFQETIAIATTRKKSISYYKNYRKIVANLTQNMICDGLATA
ncbi:protein FAR-RED ELONGATED HYPOCOTYL 3-like [Arachis ipaensis]|uniref:protein FAR-RED ELONGATED HYPOCOTYL 3-like n=1 Tax=Arachis ipaensis TaxID=130454 RepID=UPI0007AF42A5|nr:protein FAR-RED ELONGATED HYPOCOTYL 3-like [Arachis ipaensis]